MTEKDKGDAEGVRENGSPNEASLSPSALPATDPDYEVLKLIGRGGYGEVYLVRDRAKVCHAVKVVYRVSFDSERPYEREYDGVRKFEPISKLSENQLQIHHVGRRDREGYFYYIMEAADDVVTGRDINPDHYIPHTLSSDLGVGKGRIPAERCREIVMDLAEALEKLHGQGLVHRDIKPANIIFVNDRPKLADPGLVTDADQTVSFAGTEGYIPPEGPGKAKADVYALGMVLYEMCTGCHRRDFPRLPDGFADAPDHALLLRLNQIVARACKPDQRKRYRSAGDMRRALEALDRPPHGNRLAKAALAGSGLLAAIAVAIFLVKAPSHSTKEKERPAPAPAHAGQQPIADHGWTNSLGMRFVPVAGMKALVSVFDTRVQDYDAFAGETKTRHVKPGFEQGPAHPVVNVSWTDAESFCQWLTQKERMAGKLGDNQSYRLPTDEEWSLAAGLSAETGKSPVEKGSRQAGGYPWGAQWPPPALAGNYAAELKADDFQNTSPVGSFAANQFGLFDLGGNVWQWCEDQYDGDDRKRTLRGSSFADNAMQDVVLSHRFWGYRQNGAEWRGFRCVLDVGSNSKR